MTCSIEEERRRYAEQLAAHTLQQWNLAREKLESSNRTNLPVAQSISSRSESSAKLFSSSLWTEFHGHSGSERNTWLVQNKKRCRG